MYMEETEIVPVCIVPWDIVLGDKLQLGREAAERVRKTCRVNKNSDLAMLFLKKTALINFRSGGPIVKEA